MPESYDSLRSAAEAALRDARQALDREIADYPTPIAGCDAQFNHLLAERRRVLAANRAAAEGSYAGKRSCPITGGIWLRRSSRFTALPDHAARSTG